MGVVNALHLIKEELHLDEAVVTDPHADDDTKLLEALSILPRRCSSPSSTTRRNCDG